MSIVNGTDGNDQLFDDKGPDFGDTDVISGRGGDDTIHGVEGSNVLLGDYNPQDYPLAPYGNDIIFAGVAGDLMWGGGGNDGLFGGDGSDQMHGDTNLYREAVGDDYLVGGGGVDFIWGGGG